MREDMPGEKRLVAYVVTSERQETPSAGALIEALRDRLPDYMVPARFVFLEALPETVNGKLDRSALAPPDALEDGTAAAPDGPAETLVADLWASLLQLPSVAAEQNFFALGGHSILAARIASRLSRIFRVDVPLRTFFDHATVRALVEALAPAAGGRQRLDEVARLYRCIERMSASEVEDNLKSIGSAGPENAAENPTETFQ